MVRLVSDSACDMAELEGAELVVVPMTIYTEEMSFTDDASLDVEAMLSAFEAHHGRSYTACPSVGAWLEAFGEAKEVCVVTITSALSGSYSSAAVAADMLQKNDPTVRIRVFDSLSTGAEMRLLLEKLAALAQEGLPFEELCAAAEAYQKTTRLFYSLRSLHNLAQNGRVNKALAAGVGILGLRIIATASAEGTVESIARCKGDRRALDALEAELEKAGYRGGKLRIGHVETPELALRFYEQMHRCYPDADIRTYRARGLCGYYAERGGLFVGAETEA